MDAEIELVDPPPVRERLARPTREKREAHEVPADDCQWHEEIIGILDTSLKVSGKVFRDKICPEQESWAHDGARVLPLSPAASNIAGSCVGSPGAQV